MSRLLCIDYGSKNIGLAISDNLKIFSRPYNIISNIGYENFVISLKEIIKKEEIEKIILGLPFNLSGNMTQKTEEILGILEKLKEDLDIPIIGYDESFSSVEAKEIASANGKKTSIKKIDDIAASVILKNYMENL